MAFNPNSDFFALLRSGTPHTMKRMPVLDVVVYTLGMSGFFNVVTSDTAPLVNQPTTVWLDPANPSWGANGSVKLWDAATTQYLPATPALFVALLVATGTIPVSRILSGAGAPNNLVGANGDFYLRTDEPGGVYGPKTGGSWPAVPAPGTSREILFGATAPAGGLGIDGNFYIMTGAPGGMYQKQAGSWVLLPGLNDMAVLSGVSADGGEVPVN